VFTAVKVSVAVLVDVAVDVVDVAVDVVAVDVVVVISLTGCRTECFFCQPIVERSILLVASFLRGCYDW